MKTWVAKPDTVEKKWYIIDATDQKLGRLATEVAKILRGKNKPTFTPHVDTGDYVVVINSDKVKLSGNKMETMKYYRHSRFFGSLKEWSAREMQEKNPKFMIEDAVKGMLPKNRLSRKVIKNLKAYAGSEHPHEAQNPVELKLKEQ